MKIDFLCCLDENIDETYGINVQFEESEEEVSKKIFIVSKSAAVSAVNVVIWFAMSGIDVDVFVVLRNFKVIISY